MYHRGTIEEFTTWHDAVKITEGIPPEGRVGYVNGVPAPENERTYNYSTAIHNPDSSNDYVWLYGDYPIEGKVVLTSQGFIDLGWISV